MSPASRFLGEFEQMVLAAVLRLGERAYGVSIIDDIATHARRAVGSGALSVTLDRMERKGLIRSRLADSSEGRGGRPRRYVEITAEGMAEARQSREALMNMWRGLDEAYDG